MGENYQVMSSLKGGEGQSGAPTGPEMGLFHPARRNHLDWRQTRWRTRQVMDSLETKPALNQRLPWFYWSQENSVSKQDIVKDWFTFPSDHVWGDESVNIDARVSGSYLQGGPQSNPSQEDKIGNDSSASIVKCAYTLWYIYKMKVNELHLHITKGTHTQTQHRMSRNQVQKNN